MNRWHATAAVIALALAGCGTKHPADKVTYVADDDPRMNAAMEKARATDGSKTEHIWLTPVSYDGANFKGTVNNEPETIKTVKLGQTVTVSPAEISDWMYVENRKLVGGQTLRVLRDAATAAERAEFDESVPFIVE